MLTIKRYLLWLVLTSCLLAYGCGKAKELGKTLGDLAEVRSELIKKFGEQDVNIRANTFQNRTSVFVLYVNSPLNQKTSEDRAKRAQETAEIVRQHYVSNKNGFDSVWVGFGRVTTRFWLFHWSETLESFGFDREARALHDPGTAPSDSNQPTVRYMANQNQTEISSGSIQLEGTSEKGVLVFPHFAVAGDANKVKPKPPEDVGLDFAAFSDNPKFPNVTKIVFLSDDKIAYSTDDQFSTSKIAGGMYSEFLYLKVPIAAFLKITSGSSVKIKLNSREYTLTEYQVLKLKGLSEYLKLMGSSRKEVRK